MSFYPGQLVYFKSAASTLKYAVALVIAVEKRTFTNSLLTIFLNGKLTQCHEGWCNKVT